MMRPHRRQALLLVLMMGIVALLAQVAGVGGTRSNRSAAPTASQRAIDLVAMALLFLDQGQHQHLGAALLQVPGADMFRWHM